MDPSDAPEWVRLNFKRSSLDSYGERSKQRGVAERSDGVEIMIGEGQVHEEVESVAGGFTTITETLNLQYSETYVKKWPREKSELNELYNKENRDMK